MNNIAFLEGYLYKQAGKLSGLSNIPVDKPVKENIFKKLYDLLYGDLRKQLKAEIRQGSINWRDGA